MAWPLRPLSPPPFGLVAIGTFSLTFKKKSSFFSLVAHPFSPPLPLSGLANKKRYFFAASPTQYVIYTPASQVYRS